MAHECPDCEITLQKGRCPQCGWQGASAGESAKVPSLCPADGGRLWANGWCETGQGYLAHMSCPFACPICRHPLSWDGGCETCHGCTTGEREDWTFPGDRYEFDGAHWRQALKGPRRACTREENVIQARAVAAILAKSILTTPVGERPPRRPTREERREGRPEAGGGKAAC